VETVLLSLNRISMEDFMERLSLQRSSMEDGVRGETEFDELEESICGACEVPAVHVLLSLDGPSKHGHTTANALQCGVPATMSEKTCNGRMTQDRELGSPILLYKPTAFSMCSELWRQQRLKHPPPQLILVLFCHSFARRGCCCCRSPNHKKETLPTFLQTHCQIMELRNGKCSYTAKGNKDN